MRSSHGSATGRSEETARRPLRHLRAPAARAHRPRVGVLALPPLEDRPGVPEVPARAGARVPRATRPGVEAPGRHGAACGLVACGGDASSPAATTRWKSLSPATLERTEVAAARVGRFIYVMGGFEKRRGATTAVTERYDIRADRWRRVADMPAGLNHAAAVAYRGDVYVIGGYRGRATLDDEVATLSRYDPERNRWTRLRARRRAAARSPPA